MKVRIWRSLGLVALVALTMAAVSLAAGKVKPKSGKFVGTKHYKVAGQAGSATLTVNVAKGKITGFDFLGSPAPVDKKHSHGFACGAANDYTTKGMKRSGTVAASGRFNVTFTLKNKTVSDKVTLVGRFLSPTKAKATWHDVSDIKVASSHCDTGKIAFTITHK